MTLTRVPALERKTPDRTVLYLSILSALLFAPFGLYLPYFPVWLQARGFSETEIAAVIATPIFLRVVTTPVVATIADMQGIALTLAACAVTMCAAFSFLSFVDGFALIFAATAIAAIAMGMLPTLADALALTEVRRVHASGHGPITFSHIRLWTPIGVLLTMLLSGPIVGILPGTRIIYAIAGMAALPALAAVLAASRLHPHRKFGKDAGGSPTVGFARLRLAFAGIAAAALIQSSHAEVYSFSTLHWTQSGLSSNFIGLAWAMGVAAETLFFMVTARFRGTEKHAIAFIVAGGIGAALRWLAMSTDPSPWQVLALQSMHGLSFAATYLGSVLLLASLARPTHRARMQGFLSAASALSLATATFACGKLTSAFGPSAYLAMAGLAGSGLALALIAGWLKQGLTNVGEPRPRGPDHVNRT